MGQSYGSKLFLEKGSQLDYKDLIFKQLDRIGAICLLTNTETGVMIRDTERRLELAIKILEKLCQDYIEAMPKHKEMIEAEDIKPLDKLGLIVMLLAEVGLLPERDTYEEI